MEEVAVRAGHKLKVAVDNNVLTAGNPQGILGQKLRPCPIPLLSNKYYYYYKIILYN